MSDYMFCQPQMTKAISSDLLTITEKVELLIDDIACIEGGILPDVCNSMRRNLARIEEAAQDREYIIRQIESGAEDVSIIVKCQVRGTPPPKGLLRESMLINGKTYHSHVEYIEDSSNWSPQMEYVRTKSGQELCYPKNVRVGGTEECLNTLKNFQDMLTKGIASYIANAFSEMGLCDKETAQKILERNNAYPDSSIIISTNDEAVTDNGNEKDITRIINPVQKIETEDSQVDEESSNLPYIDTNQPWIYNVQSERTVDSIAEQYGLPTEQIYELNDLDEKDARLPAGTKLKLPLIIAAGGAAVGGAAYAVYKNRKEKEAKQEVSYDEDEYKNFGLIEEET